MKMPRNRMIKPEFCSDGKIGRLSRDSRLLFILMWMHSDDYGVISGVDRFILGNCFENDETVTSDMLKLWIDELCKYDFIIPFKSDYKLWYKIKNWGKHQKVDKPSKRRNPIFIEKKPISKDSEKSSESLAKDSEIPADERERERERESLYSKIKCLDCLYFSKEEFQHLKEIYKSKEMLDKGLSCLNNYLMSSGKTYKSHYHAMSGWVYDKFKKEIVNSLSYKYDPSLHDKGIELLKKSGQYVDFGEFTNE